MDTITDMRVEAATLTAEARQLRIESKRTLRRARRAAFTLTTGTDDRGRKYTKRVRVQDQKREGKARLAYHNYNTIYQERMAVRREARLLHLARMLMKGVEYHTVEAFTYERVDVDELYSMVWGWCPTMTREYVAEWLGQDAA